MSTNCYNTAIYIVGSDIHLIEYQAVLGFLTKKINNVVVIGDGEIDILSSMQGAITPTLNSVKENNPEFLTGKILVYISAHGKNNDGEHIIQTSKEGDYITSKELFELLGTKINQSMDVVFVPCHGKAALKDIDMLPVGSRVMIFSDADHTTKFSNQVITLRDMLAMENFSFEAFYDNYLAHLGSIEYPIIAEVGGNIIDPLALSAKYIGKAITTASREYIHKNFAFNICKDESCHQNIDKLMDKIESSESMEEFTRTGGKYVTMFFSLVPDYNSMEVMSDYIQFSSFNASAQLCTQKRIYFKKILDRHFLDLKIPFEVDLSYPWFEQDNNNEDDEDSENDQSFDRDLYNRHTILSSLKSNDKFPAPEYPEFGKVIGIIKDIEASNMQADQDFSF